MNLRLPRYQRGAQTGLGLWSDVALVRIRGLEPRLPAPKAGALTLTRYPVSTHPGSRTLNLRHLRPAPLPIGLGGLVDRLRADGRPRTSYLLPGEQARVHMRIIRVYGLAAVPAGGEDGSRTRNRLLAKQVPYRSATSPTIVGAHRGNRTLTSRRTPRPQRGPSTCSGR